MPDETSSPRDAPLGDQQSETGSLVAFPRVRQRPPDNNLPLQLSSFVGREKEVARVERLLLGGATRLVTLCGPGGCGKTRLALAVARDLLEGFEDGVWWVELASLSDPKLVAGAVASALGVREVPDRSPTETLVEHLEPRKTLVVLDNCEHLVDGCAALADALLRACPDLKVLATSREPLRIAGEATGIVPSLSLPDPQHLPPTEELARYEAVRLFAERAKAVDAGFELTEHNAWAMARLCRKLEGIPLAIELAAARTRVLTAEQILERLEDPLGLLTAGSRTAAARHQTLRATLQWSYKLLSEQERELLGRLSVFAGGWDLEAAEAVGAAEPVQAGQVLDLLSMLVDKSLVVAEGEEEGASSYVRYRMLEPVRQYGREKLEESTEAPEVLRRHAEHYLAFAEEAEPELLGPDQGRWLRRLRTEFGNLRGALSWSLESGQEGELAQELQLRLAAALWRFWGVEGFEEGKRWLRTALERDPGGFPVARAKALGALGFILLFQQSYGPGIDALEEAITLHKELGDESRAAYALASLGYAVLHGGYLERVPAFVEEGEALMRGDLDGHARAFLRMVLAAASLLEEGDLASVVARLEESLALCRELGDMRLVAMSLLILGSIELARDDLDRGATLLEEGVRIPWELKDRLCGVYYVWTLGKVNALQRRPVRAATLWGAAEGLRERMGMSLSRFDPIHSGYEQDLAAARSALDEAAWAAAWVQGRAMTPDQAVEYALGEVEEPTVAPTTTTTTIPVAPDPPAVSSTDKPAEALPAQAEKAPPPEPLRFFALGHSRVQRGERTLAPADFGYAKPRELLFYLLSHPEGCTKERIGLDLWPEASPSQLRGSLHEALRRLRRALGASEWIVHHRGRYAFERSLEHSFDVGAFEENLLAAADAEAPERAIALLEEAVGLYGGEFLEDFLDSEWAEERREELRHKHRQALLSLGGLLFKEGRHDRAAEVYRKAISEDEYQESAHRGLMRSYAQMGERGWALAHYRALVEALRERLGTTPASETRALYEGLRRGSEGVY